MYNQKAVITLLLSLAICADNCFPAYDLTIVSSDICFANGLERIPLMVADLLGEQMAINFVPPARVVFQDIPSKVARLIKQHTNRATGKVAVLFDPLWYPLPKCNFYQNVPKADLKLAYSMIEGTAIPARWVEILNSSFDAVVVPDSWLVDVYKKSKVGIPIFVVPIGLYLEPFLDRPLQHKPHEVFTFGVSAACVPGKNHKLLIQAFIEEFGKHNPRIRLRLHSRGGFDVQEIKAYVASLEATNIEFVHASLSQKEYVDFMASIDCYVLLSMGEGFSITPREALALGRPVILSDNTAHKTIVSSGLVRAVPADMPERAYYGVFRAEVGYKFNCKLADARFAMRDVYTNYATYLEQAHRGREWVKQYQYTALEPLYRTLIKPHTVKKGTSDKITPHALITTSSRLLKKYRRVISA